MDVPPLPPRPLPYAPAAPKRHATARALAIASPLFILCAVASGEGISRLAPRLGVRSGEYYGFLAAWFCVFVGLVVGAVAWAQVAAGERRWVKIAALVGVVTNGMGFAMGAIIFLLRRS